MAVVKKCQYPHEVDIRTTIYINVTLKVLHALACES